MTGRFAFLRSARWLGLIAVVLAFVMLCVALGFWQWHRFEDRLAHARQVEAAYESEPVPLTEAVDGLTVTTAEEWRPVQLLGRYVDDATLVLRNRPVDGTPAVHVVTPFVADTEEGQAVVVVDRGWVPTAQVDDAGEVPQAPSAGVALTARLRVAEPPADRDPPAGQLYTLDPEGVLAAAGEVTDLGAAADLPVLDGYVTMTREVLAPPAAAAGPADDLGGYPRPESRWGLNLSYAFQWWLFAVGGVVALVVLARREAAEQAGEAPRRRRPSAEDEEDALVDAQLRER